MDVDHIVNPFFHSLDSPRTMKNVLSSIDPKSIADKAQSLSKKAASTGAQITENAQKMVGQSLDASKKKVEGAISQVSEKVVTTGSQITDDAHQLMDQSIKRSKTIMMDTVSSTKETVSTGIQAAKDATDAISQSTSIEKVTDTVKTVSQKVVDTGMQASEDAKKIVGQSLDVTKNKVGDLMTLTHSKFRGLHLNLSDATESYAITVQDVISKGKDQFIQYTGQTGDLISQGSRHFAQYIDQIDPDGRYRDHLKGAAVAIGTATAAGYGKIIAASPEFSQLSPYLKVKFAVAGLRDSAWRTVPFAEGFYESSVPQVVRNLGNDAVVEFLQGKHASHITSVHNDPTISTVDGNIVWEAAHKNLARGADNMTSAELAQANMSNMIDAAGIVAGEALETAAMAGCVGMALEGIVSLGEQVFYVYSGERTTKDAFKIIAENMVKKGIMSAIGGFVITIAIACGAGPFLASMAPVLVTIGGTVFLISAASRIVKAYQDTREKPEDSTELAIA